MCFVTADSKWFIGTFFVNADSEGVRTNPSKQLCTRTEVGQALRKEVRSITQAEE
jgi:hypothetical protein